MSIIQISSMMVRGSYVLNGGQVRSRRCGGEEGALFARFQSGSNRNHIVFVILVFHVSIKGGCWK